MSIIHTIIIIFTLLIFSFDSNSSEKNPTDAELKAHLLSKKNDFEVLISILRKTEYSSVLWIKGRSLTARSGNNKNAVWDKSPKLDEFVNTAIRFGFGSLLIGLDHHGNWGISTGQEVVFLGGDPSRGTAAVKTIKKSFSFGNQPEVSICTPVTIEKSINGQCYIPLINNWFLYKHWFTYDPAIEQT